MNRMIFQNVVIIGSGFSGLAMAIQLKRQHSFKRFTIIEKYGSLGGTWRDNTYPGCGVDVPGALYSLSFAPNKRYSKWYPRQREILQYMLEIAKTFDILPNIQFDTEVTSSRWVEDSRTWQVHCKNTRTGGIHQIQCQVLISATGMFSTPYMAEEIEGMGLFTGPVMHTARWNEAVDLKDKNIIVIGNGCSASQLIPEIAKGSANVYQFIRTPQTYVRSSNPSIPHFLKWTWSCLPFLYWIFRWIVFHILEYAFLAYKTDSNDATSRRRHAQKRSRIHVRQTAPKQYWHLLTPRYEMGCKRIVLDSGYLKVLGDENVHLLNEKICSVTENSVITEKGSEYFADVIVLATGFATGNFAIDIIGKNGVTIQEHWKHMSAGRMSAYQSIAVSGFPNLFFIYGPNSSFAHTSALFSIENSVALVLTMMDGVLKGAIRAVEVRQSYERDYDTAAQAELQKRVWHAEAGGCISYYLSRDGGNGILYPWSGYTMLSTMWRPDYSAWIYYY